MEKTDKVGCKVEDYEGILSIS